MTWQQFASWFLTASLGALIIKIFDLAVSRYTQKTTRKENKINFLLDYIKQYAELSALYRFKTNASSKLIMTAKGKPKRGKAGNLLSKSTVFEPEVLFDDAIRKLKGADIDSAIIQKIAAIRIAGSEAVDIANEIDKTNKLKKDLNDLYIKTVWTIDIIMGSKDKGKPSDNFNNLVDALKEADELRGEVRKRVETYL